MLSFTDYRLCEIIFVMVVEGENLPLKHEKIEPISETTRSTIYRVKESDIDDSSYVIKIWKDVPPQETNESPDGYRIRRKNHAIQVITQEKEEESIATSYLNKYSPDVKIPQSHWFILNDTSGFPTPARVQEYIKGKTIKGMDISELTERQLGIIKSLLLASQQCFRETGRNLDIIGGLYQEPILNRICHTVTGLIRYSTNILLSENGEVMLVDHQLGKRGKILGTAKFLRLILDQRELERIIRNSLPLKRQKSFFHPNRNQPIP